MKIENITKNTVIAKNVRLADTFGSRLIGLMGKKNLGEQEGLYISKCRQIHMFFMRFALDVIFVDKDLKCVHIIKNIKPWRVSKYVIDADDCIELPVGSIEVSKTEIGDMLKCRTK